MGLGAIGRDIARAVQQKPELDLVAVLDMDTSLVGRSLPEILDAPAPDLRVTSDLTAAFHLASGGLLLHATGSRLTDVVSQIEAALGAGMAVVSTCEELAYPWLRHPQLAEKIDRAANRKKAAVLGVGVNPGFVLDRLVATLGGVVGKVDRVIAERVVDSRTRRQALARKTGAGLSQEAFDEAVERGEVGHVGLMESAALAALGVGLELDEVDEDIDPVLALEDVGVASGLAVKKGGISGVHQVARAFRDGREVVRLSLTIALGAPAPHDAIVIDGDPPILCRIEGGVAGDRATAWSVVHAAPLVRDAAPGLMTVLDLPAGR